MGLLRTRKEESAMMIGNDGFSKINHLITCEKVGRVPNVSNLYCKGVVKIHEVLNSKDRVIQFTGCK